MKKNMQKSTFPPCSLLGSFFLLRAQSQPIQHIQGLPDSPAQTPSGGKGENMKDCHDLILNSFFQASG